ncbi:MAG: diphthine synthase [Thermoprotei archaeon]|nr:MAG: diphthine synthase [Thermoprotei archaeon]
MLVFVGLGLYNCADLTLRGLEVLRHADKVYLDTYTSIVPGFSIEVLESLIGKKVVPVDRSILEGRKLINILEEAREKNVALLVPGDPFIATTHISIRLEAEKHGIKTEVVHAPSVISSAISATGLQVYKFGKIVTLVYPDPEIGFYPISSYEVLKDNFNRKLHTFFLLDLREDRKMTIADAVDVLFLLEEKVGDGIISSETLGIGMARIGSPDLILKAGTLEDLKKHDFGPPPHSLIIPGLLHPMEAEALLLLCNANKEMIEKWMKKIK